MTPYTMTFDETFRAIRSGDLGIICAFVIETAIMLTPVGILAGAYFWS